MGDSLDRRAFMRSMVGAALVKPVTYAAGSSIPVAFTADDMIATLFDLKAAYMKTAVWLVSPAALVSIAGEAKAREIMSQMEADNGTEE